MREISILEVCRTFKNTFDPLLSDDINFVNLHGGTIDLGKILREEMIMQMM